MPVSTPSSSSSPSSSSAPSFFSICQALRSCVHQTPHSSVHAYETVLNTLPLQAHLLIVGIAPSNPLIAAKHILLERNITVVAIDTNEHAVTQCQESIHHHQLKSHVRVYHSNIHSFSIRDGRFFDHIFFCTSLMTISRPVQALKRSVHELLVDREDGRIFFMETFQLQKSFWLELVQPIVVYEQDFEDTLHLAKLSIVAVYPIHDQRNHTHVERESRVVQTRSNLYVPKYKEDLN